MSCYGILSKFHSREGRIMFQHVLVPTDLSSKNQRTLEIGVKVASLGQGKVTLLHVIELIADTPFEEFEDFYTRLEQKAQQAMEELAAPYPVNEVHLERAIVYGDRAQEILKFAETHDVDLIVVNSHKIEPDAPTQGWGTISYKVGILAQCPVMLVK
jgi:universal stress protein A